MFSKIKTLVLTAAAMLIGTVSLTANAVTLQDVINTYCKRDCVSAARLMDVATRVSTSSKIDVYAILAIIHVESKYHIKAKNGSSVGLSQVLLRYHKKKFFGKNYYDIEDNVFAGMHVFKDCLAKFKRNYDKAYSCYNGGGDPRYRTKVKAAYAMLKKVKLPPSPKDPLGTFIATRM